MGFIDRIGARAIELGRYVLYLLGLLYLSLKVIWTERDLGQRNFLQQVLLQIYFTGVQSSVHMAVIGVALGAVGAWQGASGVGAISGAETLGRTLAMVILREVAPLVTGTVIIVRSVTAIAAELGMMRVQREVEALEVMGLSPVRQLVTPRLLGGVFAFFGLNILFNFAALVSGLAVGAVVAALPAELILRSVISAVQPIEILVFAIKVVGGGAGVFTIACFHGLSVNRASTEVPIAVSKAAYHALVFLLVLHATVSVSAFLRDPHIRGLTEVLL